MIFTPPRQPSRRSLLLLFLIFLCVWVPFMTAALTAKVGGNLKYGDAKRLSYCNFSLSRVLN